MACPSRQDLKMLSLLTWRGAGRRSLIALVIGLSLLGAVISGCGTQTLKTSADTFLSDNSTLEAINLLKNNFLYADRLPAKYSLLSGEALARSVAADYGSLEGFVASLGDPYTRYVPSGGDTLSTRLRPSAYGGIGVLIKIVSHVAVVDYALPDGPARSAGLRAGDEIVKVDGLATSGLSVSQVADMIRGEAGASVDLSVLRNGSPLEFNLKRVLLQSKNAYDEVLAGGVGYIKLIQFGFNASADFEKAYNELPASIEALVIDLRDNGGGELSTTIRLASYFVPDGQPVLWYRGRDGVMNDYLAASGIKIKLPLVVLVNERSASASEILTAALREKAGATVVGERTYGKGVMQRSYGLSDGSTLYITVAEFFTPTQKKINGLGLTPDVAAALSDDDFLAGKDPQLAAALAALPPAKATVKAVTLKPIWRGQPITLPPGLERLIDLIDESEWKVK